MPLSARLRLLWLTLVVVLLDRATKAWIESRGPGAFPITIVPDKFYLVFSRNTGVAFSFLDGLSSPLLRHILIGGSLVIILCIAWMLLARRGIGAGSAAGLALLLGGAIGNVTDRILHGAVTDFLEVYLRFLPWSPFNPWPAFNVADSAIFVGAVLVVLDVLFSRKQQSSAHR